MNGSWPRRVRKVESKFQIAVTRSACSLAIAAILAACATQPAAQPHTDGFATGLFHGFTAVLALAGSLFFKIRIYAFPNGGFWYDAGFVLGFGLNIIVVTLVLLPKIGGFITRRH